MQPRKAKGEPGAFEPRSSETNCRDQRKHSDTAPGSSSLARVGMEPPIRVLVSRKTEIADATEKNRLLHHIDVLASFGAEALPVSRLQAAQVGDRTVATHNNETRPQLSPSYRRPHPRGLQFFETKERPARIVPR